MRAKEFFRKVQFLLMLALGTYPVGACIIVFVAPELLPYMWFMPVCYFLLGLMSFGIPAKFRLGVGILGAVLFLLPCAIYLQSNARNMMLTFAAGYSALLLWSLRIPGWDSTQELSVSWLGGCFAVILTGCLLSYYEPRLETVSGWMRASAFVYVFFAMLSLNRSSISLASGGRQGFSRSMRNKNILLTVGMFVIALAVALIPSVYGLIKDLFSWLGMVMEKIASLFPEETLPTGTETTEPPTTGNAEGIEVLRDAMQSKRTSKVVFFMMAAIAIGVFTPVCGYALYKIGKAIYRALHKLVSGIVIGASTQAEDFVDEITDTRADARAEHYRGEEKKASGQGIAVSAMMPAEQIRYRYRRLAKKHQWKAYKTARENLTEDAAQLYERARYSDHPITRQDADQFKNKTK